MGTSLPIAPRYYKPALVSQCARGHNAFFNACYDLRLRNERSANRPSNPIPARANEDGSGTCEKFCATEVIVAEFLFPQPSVTLISFSTQMVFSGVLNWTL